MRDSEIFRNAIAAKHAEDSAAATAKAKGNEKLAELYSELQRMSEDLRKYSVEFEWGHGRGSSSDDKCIILNKTRKKKETVFWGTGSNAIECSKNDGSLIAWSCVGADTTIERLGSTAKEAAEAIAKSIVSDDTLPAHGDYLNRDDTRYISNSEATTKEFRKYAIIVFWCAIVLFVVYLTNR